MSKTSANLARALQSTRPGEHWDANKRLQWNMDVKVIAAMLYRFHSPSRENFIAACGGLHNV